MALTSEHQLSGEEVTKRLNELCKKREEIDKEIEELQRAQDAAKKEKEWNQLMRELKELTKKDSSFIALSNAISDAVKSFNDSLKPPTNYEEEAKDDAGYVIPYCDTDDYGDLSVFDSLVETEVNSIQEGLTAAAAVPAAGSEAKVALHASNSNKSNNSSAATRHLCLLRLLLLTLNVGRLETITDFNTVEEESYRPTSDAEELKESIAAVWQWLLYENLNILSAEENQKWKSVVKDYLGSPFDAES